MNSPERMRDSQEADPKGTKPWNTLPGRIGLMLCGVFAVWLVGYSLLPSLSTPAGFRNRVESFNNLKHIGLALYNYHDVYGTLPPAYLPDEEGRPKHSWRVLILPHIEQGDLYEQYDLDKPWDHPDNLKLLSRMPKAYASPFAKNAAARGETPYMAIAGEHTALRNSDRPTRFGDFYKGMIHVATHIENHNHTVPWTKPEDVSPERIVTNHDKLTHNIYGGFLVVTADATVRFAPVELPAEELEKTLTLIGLDVVELPIVETEKEKDKKPTVWSYGSN